MIKKRNHNPSDTPNTDAIEARYAGTGPTPEAMELYEYARTMEKNIAQQVQYNEALVTIGNAMMTAIAELSGETMPTPARRLQLIDGWNRAIGKKPQSLERSKGAMEQRFLKRD